MLGRTPSVAGDRIQTGLKKNSKSGGGGHITGFPNCIQELKGLVKTCLLLALFLCVATLSSSFSVTSFSTPVERHLNVLNQILRVKSPWPEEDRLFAPESVSVARG